MGDLIEVASDFVERGGCPGESLRVDRRRSLRAWPRRAKPRSAKEAGEAESRSAGAFFQPGALVVRQADEHSASRPLPFLAAAAATELRLRRSAHAHTSHGEPNGSADRDATTRRKT